MYAYYEQTSKLVMDRYSCCCGNDKVFTMAQTQPMPMHGADRIKTEHGIIITVDTTDYENLLFYSYLNN